MHALADQLPMHDVELDNRFGEIRIDSNRDSTRHNAIQRDLTRFPLDLLRR